MAYGGIMFYNLHMPLYILGTFTEYPSNNPTKKQLRNPQLLFCGPAWA